jgi:ectoine hydroxylase-related dioxygenase (phytanoyl-CoA dioxygenase family)
VQARSATDRVLGARPGGPAPGGIDGVRAPHQDYPNVQGTAEVYTAWAPLIDCPPEVGGLQVARGSHRLGVLEFGIGNGAGGIEILDSLEGCWTGGPMRVGDVLVFHSLTRDPDPAKRERAARLLATLDAPTTPVAPAY